VSRTAVIEQAGERRLAPVESMRALAALGVLLFHAELLTLSDNHLLTVNVPTRILVSGSHGVFLFFTLTGYLMFRPFAQRAWGAGGPVNLRRYARNRALRILPLYYVAIVFLLIAQGASTTFWWRFPLLLENYWNNSNQRVDGPLWSVVVELQFYVVIPVLAWVLTRATRRTGGIALLNLAVIGLAGREIAVLHHDINDNVWRTTFVVTFVWFMPGMVLAWIECCWTRLPRWLVAPFDRATTWFVAGVACWLLQPLWSTPAELYLVANFLLVGSCVLPLRRGLSTALLSWRPVAAVGVVSYSLYVWHVPILHRIDSWPWLDTGAMPLVAAGLPLCLAAAVVSYYVVERPFLRLRRTWTPTAPARVHEQRAALEPVLERV
jgi:peptidoglycan/LPS O-acetylase OafA/YrhL